MWSTSLLAGRFRRQDGDVIPVAITALLAVSLLAQLPAPIYRFDGEDDGDGFGFSVAGIDDITGDGLPEIVVGIPFADDPNGENPFDDRGKVQVLSGASGSVVYEWWGPHSTAYFGRYVNAAADVDADGIADIIIGIVRDDTNGNEAGAAAVFLGSTGQEIHRWYGIDDFDKFGRTCARIGDLNGDGADEVIVGGYQPVTLNNGVGEGYARVFSGQTGSMMYEVRGEDNGDMFGVSVCGFAIGGDIGDVNADEVPDFAVGSMEAEDESFVPAAQRQRAGSVSAFSGFDGSLLWRKYATDFYASPYAFGHAGDQFGRYIAPAGDANGDGVPDLVVGAIFGDHTDDLFGNNFLDHGYVTILSGSTGLPIIIFPNAGPGTSPYIRYGGSTNDHLGVAVAGIEDVDGDGVFEIAAGAVPGNYVKVFSTLELIEVAHIAGTNPLNFFGQSVRGIGDLNSNGRRDFLIGDGAADPPDSPDAGSTWAYTFP